MKPSIKPSKNLRRFLIGDARMHVRHMYAKENFPFKTGMEPFHSDPEWVWVLVKNGKACGALWGCKAHGMLVLLRIVVPSDGPKAGIVLLLRQAVKESLERGLFMYMCALEDVNPAEAKLMKIVARAGGYFKELHGVWAFGRLEEAAEF